MTNIDAGRQRIRRLPDKPIVGETYPNAGGVYKVDRYDAERDLAFGRCNCISNMKGEITMAIKSKARHDLTLRSIKREIAAGRDVAFWLDKAYTHYDNGLLDEADIAEVETLAQAYYDAVDARKSADEVTETPDVPEVDGAENTTDE